MMLLAKPPTGKHSLLEDAQAILIGTTLVALAVQFLGASNLLTGQIAGMALLGTYVSDYSFGTIFFVLNLPFYLIALRVLGLRFTLKSLASVTLMSAIADALPLVLTVNTLPPAVGAMLFGILAGVGLLLLFRHGATLGGIGIVALWLQDTRGIAAGNTQLAFDVFVFGLALFVLPWPAVAWSLLGAAVLNVIITTNHRRDRYIARS